MIARATDLHRRRPTARLVGRQRELSRLARLLGPDGAAVVHVDGVAGIGKSTLLAAFAAQAQAGGASTVVLDCRLLEPTERGVLRAVAGALGADVGEPELDAVVQQLADLDRRVVLVLDQFEVLRLVDTWLRQAFVPLLPGNVRLVIGSREAPVAAWLTSPELTGLVDRLVLAPLDAADAVGLFAALGVDAARATRLNGVVHGHPLAIRLAASTAAGRSDLNLDDVAAHAVLDGLTRLFLEDVPDPVTRTVLEAASVVRRTTASLLAQLLPDVEPQEAFGRLRDLPFVEIRQDGLVLHEAVQGSVAGYVRSTDPTRYRRYRRAAWRALRDEVRQAPAAELWRYTADMLYLIENPVIREAFFPSGAQPLAVEPARPEDEAAIRAITRRHDGEVAADAMAGWYRRAPGSFSAIRDRDGVTVAWFCLLDRALIFDAGVDDPVVAGWRRHIRANPPPAGQEILGFRRWLDLDHGERPSSSQAASWLDVKRTYMELRPNLRRIYTVVEEPATYLPIVHRLGFRPLGEADGVATLGDHRFTSVALDFGPNSVDGWLAGLVAAELGLEDAVAVDEDAREVRFDGHVVRLTPLEFGVLRCLEEHHGRVVTRATLVESVWGDTAETSSNVVDVVVRRLRQKLGGSGAAIETVRGTGYRLGR